VIPTDVPTTVPVPSPLNVRIPSTAFEKEKELPLVNGCRDELNPDGPAGLVGVPGPLFPGATRHAAVPVNPYAPLRLGESATAFAAHAIATTDADTISTRCIDSPSLALWFIWVFSPRESTSTRNLLVQGGVCKKPNVL